MKVKINNETGEWIELEKGSKDPESVYFDGELITRLDYIQNKLLKNNWDVVIIVDGIEGSGKSTLGLQIAWLLSNGKLTMKNLILGLEDAPDKLEKAEQGEIFVMDEGSLSFGSRETMKREQVELIKIFNVIRQKNLGLIVVAPSFFDLNKYISVHRSRALIHVYTDKDLTRGRFAFFNQKGKNILYSEGKRNYNSYSKPVANFYGRFVNHNPLGEEYIKAKERSMFEAFQSRKKKLPNKKDVLIELVNNYKERNPNVTQENMAQIFGVTRKTLAGYLKKPINTKEITHNV